MIFEFLKKRPYLLLFATSILFLLLKIFLNTNSKTTLNISDTYFVISRKDVYLIVFILLGITSLVYMLLDFFRINISKRSILFHIFGLLTTIILFFYLNDLSDQFDLKKKEFEDLINPTDFNKYIFIVILITISLQFFFLINIFVSIIKKLRTSVTK